MGYVFGKAICVAGDDGQLHGLCFNHGVAEPFGDCGVKKEVGPRHLLFDFSARCGAKKLGRVIKAKLMAGEGDGG